MVVCLFLEQRNLDLSLKNSIDLVRKQQNSINIIFRTLLSFEWHTHKSSFFLQEKRRLYHMRNVKVNKIKDIIEKQNTNLTPSRRAPQAPPISAAPQGSPNMPMHMMPPGTQGYRPNIPYR